MCAGWVPRQLTAGMKTARLEACRRLLARCRSEGNDFQCSEVTGGEIWAHHCDTELKSQSVEYIYTLLLEIKNSRLKLPLENAC